MSNRVEEQAKLIYIGATVSQLAQMFGMSQKTVQQRLIGRVIPSKPKGATEKDPLRYHVKDAAPFLCEPKIDIEEVLKNLSPSKFPPMLQDPFWKAQKSRLEVEEKLGNLWNTQRVVEILGEAFMPCRMAILMFKENIEQQEVLSPAQRALLDEMADSLLEGLRAGLVTQFEGVYKPKEDEHGMPLGNATTIPVEVDGSELPYNDGFDDE